jgi:heme exporter protein CcmD
MDYSAPHLGFVYASYGLSAIVLAGLLIWVITRSRKLVAELAAKNLSDPGRDAKS